MNKPREFYISEDVDGYVTCSAENKDRPFGFQYHVIEKKAHDDALKMLDEMAGALESSNLWIKDLPSCDAAYVNNKHALDNYRKWKEGMK